MSRWKTSNTAVYNVAYHIIFCPKYRRKVLVGEVKERLRELLYEKAEPNRPPQQIVGQFKGYTSRVLRKEFASLRSRLPTLWTRSYYLETIGHISEETIRKYIEDQKNA